jgi:hypothetical protein
MGIGQKTGAVLGVADLDSNSITQFRQAAATLSRAAYQHAGNRPDIEREQSDDRVDARRLHFRQAARFRGREPGFRGICRFSVVRVQQLFDRVADPRSNLFERAIEVLECCDRLAVSGKRL